MHKTLFLKLKRYLIDFIQAHLIVTIVSLPILISWGMPLSKVGIIGNLIFAPFLTAFLVLSSIIFFTELINIPNSFLINLLNKLTTMWNQFLSYGNKDWLIGFYKPNLIILIAIPLITFFILRLKIINTITKRVCFLCLMLFSSTFYLSYPHLIKKQEQKVSIQNKLQITTDKNGKINIVDSGLFNRKKSFESFLDFELKPCVLKNFGSLHINNLTISKPSISNFKAGIEFCKIFNLKQLTLPIFNKKLSNYEWRLFFDLKRTLQENNVTFVRASTKNFQPSYQ